MVKMDQSGGRNSLFGFHICFSVAIIVFIVMLLTGLGFVDRTNTLVLGDFYSLLL